LVVGLKSTDLAGKVEIMGVVQDLYTSSCYSVFVILTKEESCVLAG
jgi:hypothetical protein